MYAEDYLIINLVTDEMERKFLLDGTCLMEFENHIEILTILGRALTIGWWRQNDNIWITYTESDDDLTYWANLSYKNTMAVICERSTHESGL
jgi:hypothetical protein